MSPVLSLSRSPQVIGNGSFGVVYQARLIDSQEMVAIKKVLQDKRFKVRHQPDGAFKVVWFFPATKEANCL